MPNYRRWNGGATAVAQVKTIRFTTSAANDVVTITMTAEDGSTQAVTHTVADTNNNTTAAAVQAVCNSSSLSLFQEVSFTVSTDTVTVTAGLAGRPFQLAVTDDGSTAYTVADPTASAGPNDWNTAANWSGSTKPATGDLVAFSDGSFDVLYGLNQAGVVLYQMSVTEGFLGNIGTVDAPLRIETDNSDGAAETSLNLSGSGFVYNFSGDFPIVNITANSSVLKVKGEISETNIVGGAVAGSITLDSSDATSSGNVITVSNVSPACVIKIPATATNTGNIIQDSGRIELSAVTKSTKSSLLLSGSGIFTTKDAGQIATAGGALGVAPAAITVIGGTYRHESDADLSGDTLSLFLFDGEADFSKVKAKTSGEFVSLGNVKVFGGRLDDSAAGKLTTFASLTKVGGDVLQPAGTLSSAKR